MAPSSEPTLNASLQESGLRLRHGPLDTAERHIPHALLMRRRRPARCCAND
ncbi:hypothetical protein [Streptomyces flaveolus]|uniref:hypothetical protein n=1 Tax=Streptomyces flaveolus TaxID=67297 RepID=UPI00370085FC